MGTDIFAGTTVRSSNWLLGPCLKAWPPRLHNSADAAVRNLRESTPMGKAAQIDIVRRAYELWQQAGEPQGRDQESGGERAAGSLKQKHPMALDKNLSHLFQHQLGLREPS